MDPLMDNSTPATGHFTPLWDAVPLPYYREAGKLPAPLPTFCEIRSSARILGERAAQKTVAVGKHYVVKFGRGTSIQEGQNLLFIEQNLAIAAPRLHAMYQEEDSPVLVMDLIVGESLQTIWPTLSDGTKVNIMTELRSMLRQMRDLPPANLYGSVDGGSMPYFLFHSNEPDETRTGPFATEDHLSQALAKQLQAINELNAQPSHKARYYSKNIPATLRGHSPTFSHCDVQRKNIIVRLADKGKDENGLEAQVTLIDWETAGWYPDHWEYFTAFTAFTWDDDWSEVIDLALDPWPGEVAVLMMVYHDLFY